MVFTIWTQGCSYIQPPYHVHRLLNWLQSFFALSLRQHSKSESIAILKISVKHWLDLIGHYLVLQSTSGEKGNTGFRGTRGFPGRNGVPGLPGDQGDTGVMGFPGSRGLPGPKGLQGVTGFQGEPGDQVNRVVVKCPGLCSYLLPLRNMMKGACIEETASVVGAVHSLMKHLRALVMF